MSVSFRVKANSSIHAPFHGAKLALFLGDNLVTILRDDLATIPWPNHWDLPGGGREGRESAVECVLRETREEVGLSVDPSALDWARAYGGNGRATWFFAARLPRSKSARIRLGAEGQRLALMPPHRYLAHPRAIPDFQSRLADYLAACPMPQT